MTLLHGTQNIYRGMSSRCSEKHDDVTYTIACTSRTSRNGSITEMRDTGFPYTYLYNNNELGNKIREAMR